MRFHIVCVDVFAKRSQAVVSRSDWQVCNSIRQRDDVTFSVLNTQRVGMSASWSATAAVPQNSPASHNLRTTARVLGTSGGAMPGPGRSYALPLKKIGPGSGTCLWYLAWFVSLLNFVLTLVLIFWLSFLSELYNTSLSVRMLECNTEMSYSDEPVKLVFKLHYST